MPGVFMDLFCWDFCELPARFAVTPIPSCVPGVVSKPRCVSPSTLFQGHRFCARCCSSNPVSGAAGSRGSSAISTWKNSVWSEWNTWSWKRPLPPRSCPARCSRFVKGVAALGYLGSGKRDELWIIHSWKTQPFPPGISELLPGASYTEQSDLYLVSTKRADMLRASFITCHKDSPRFSRTELWGGNGRYRPRRNVFSSASCLLSKQVSSLPSPRSSQVGHIQGHVCLGLFHVVKAGKASLPCQGMLHLWGALTWDYTADTAEPWEPVCKNRLQGEEIVLAHV